MELSPMLLYMVTTMITPGPNNLSMMYLSAQHGFRGASRFFVGSASALLVKVLLCGGLNVLLADLLPPLVRWLKWLGAAYMLYLAWKTLKSSTEIEEKHGESSFLSGALLQFVNPKIYIYCIVSMQAYVLPFYQGRWGILMFFALLLAFIGFVFTLCWALFGTVFKLVFSKYGKLTNIIMALLLMVAQFTTKALRI